MAFTEVQPEDTQLPSNWWGDVLSTVARDDHPVTVEDAAGGRFVLVPEARYRALESAEGVATGAVTGAQAGIAASRRSRATLTARERQILQMIADGQPGSAVAERLGLAPNTVAQHLTSVRRKYGVRSSAAAAAIARQDGFIS